MKSRYIRGIILSFIFVIALFVSSAMINKGNIDMTADMDSAVLPTISFEVDGRKVNLLNGHKQEMHFSAVRDTITPMNDDNVLVVNVQAYGQNVKDVKYKVYSFDGEALLTEGTADSSETEMVLPVGDVLNEREGILCVELVLEEDSSIYYYTRVIGNTDLNSSDCLAFAEEIHEAMLAGENDDLLKNVLEPNSQGDNTTLQHVTIHSDLKHAKWGDLNPEIVSEVRYSIQETKKSYTAVKMDYRVKCVGDNNEEEFHDVAEYFQVSVTGENEFLLSYDRTLQEVFDSSKVVLTSKGINLGMTGDEIQYKSNQDGTIVAFVQNRELWCFDKEESEFSLVFSFDEPGKDDVRNKFDSHDIKILSMDDQGCLTFAVYGYMNRGAHEGKSGLTIYYYNLPQNVIEEVAFVSSNQSKLMIEELGKLAYYNHELDVLYVMLAGTLQKIDLSAEETTILLNDLKEGEYVSSEDGQFLAYQSNEEKNEIIVMDFAKDSQTKIPAEEGSKIIPLGFVLGDFVYGMAKEENAGKTVSGEVVDGMHYIEIRDEKNEIVKTYEIPETYIIDVEIQGNMITLERALKQNGIYNVIAEDYITNNEETVSGIELNSYWTDLKETQYRLVFEDGIQNKKAKELKPKHVLLERTVTIPFESEEDVPRYAVYAYGDLIGLYAEAGNAIEHAKKENGIVISPKQHYVWEEGNRVAWYRNFDVPRFTVKSGETSLEACLKAVLSYVDQEVDVKAALETQTVEQILTEYTGGEGVRMKGCSSADVRYLIDKTVPVIALTGSQEAVLLVGYDAVSVTYIEPQSGAVRVKNFEAMDEWMKSSGATFFAYLK